MEDHKDGNHPGGNEKKGNYRQHGFTQLGPGRNSSFAQDISANATTSQMCVCSSTALKFK